MKPKPKKLYLSNKNRKIAGFCGGLAEYLNVDPTLIRLLYVFFTLISMGTGIVVYIIAWLIVPRNPKQ
ncbi:PspC domain-containing protein [Candidatus Woesearchaeota archaeon]|nr:PspC domain-containing protein [Candidatus Woesearchaeota archaeon]